MCLVHTFVARERRSTTPSVAGVDRRGARSWLLMYATNIAINASTTISTLYAKTNCARVHG